MSNSLEDRLLNMTIPLPERFVERTLAGGRAPTSPKPTTRMSAIARPALVGALSLGVVAGGNMLAAHYIPAYGHALADVPIAGPLLQSAGVTADQVTPASDTASSSGYDISVTGGYADAYRTIVFLDINGQPMQDRPWAWQAIAKATLTDQFGHIYKQMLDGAAGQSGAAFQPFTGKAVSGAQLTLHITEIYNREPKPHADIVDSIYGDWTLHLDLSQDSGDEELPLPAALTAGDTTYTITAVRHSSKVLHIEWTMSGPTVDRYEQLVYSFDPMTGPPTATRAAMDAIDPHMPPMLVGPDGKPTGMLPTGASTNMAFPKGQPAIGAVTTLINGPGHYTLVIPFGGATARIPIDIP